MSDEAVISQCPCCAGALSEPFYRVGPVPVHSCLMLPTAAEAKAFSMGKVALAICADCGFVTNVCFDPKWSSYSPEYEDQQSFSPTFNAFASDLADRLVKDYNLEKKAVVEIGCSKGDFLALMCETGNMTGIGIDPSAVPGRVAPPRRGSMRLISEYYGPQHLVFEADLLCNRHTLEHIQPVYDFLKMSREHAERNLGCVLCIEVPDYTRVWRDAAFEDVYYEHCTYFTPGSLASAVRRAGFSVINVERDYGDQYLVLEANLDPAADRRFDIEESPSSVHEAVESFQRRVDFLKQTWRDTIAGVRASNGKVAVWGSGSKCVSFVRTIGLDDAIDAIVDINPHRHGKFAPGLDIAISSPDDLAELKPDLLIVMNPIYLEEITATCRTMGLRAEIVALGDPELGQAA
ncbi:class I SAM-dependent methyltransferase [Ruegeria profundi]|uniref:class I SAM-dependent methyltransferase n=1 Tax=Ruegeria profundi TaxID=1685378 RepID=UPI001CD23A38|nr:class I SAM-dependent methyltransferase [Ruegeria profundi]MCA0930682.1 class I SAM-dependent methyltransferase [Ruegeria profundi]